MNFVTSNQLPPEKHTKDKQKHEHVIIFKSLFLFFWSRFYSRCKLRLVYGLS